jgi:hypothetical protein
MRVPGAALEIELGYYNSLIFRSLYIVEGLQMGSNADLLRLCASKAGNRFNWPHWAFVWF